MAKTKFSDDDMALLTDEERIGLKEHMAELAEEEAAEDAMIAAAAKGEAEGDPEPGPVEEEPEPEEEEEEPEPEPEEEEEEQPAAEGEGEEEEEPAAAAATEQEEQEEQQPAAQPSIMPAYKVPAEDAARMTAIEQQLDGLAEKFDDGELTAKEMRDQSKVLVKEQDDLKARQIMAQMSSKTTVDTWYGTTIPLFLGQHAEYVEGSLRHELLDTLVRKMQMTSASPTDPKILIDAHKRIVAELGEAAAPAAKANGHVNGAAKKKKPQREMPPNFNAMPSAERNEVVVPNKFVRLEKLKGVEYEKALARLSPADRELYLQGG